MPNHTRLVYSARDWIMSEGGARVMLERLLNRTVKRHLHTCSNMGVLDHPLVGIAKIAEAGPWSPTTLRGDYAV